jgi:hypothetical protein
MVFPCRRMSRKCALSRISCRFELTKPCSAARRRHSTPAGHRPLRPDSRIPDNFSESPGQHRLSVYQWMQFRPSAGFIHLGECR